MASSRAQSLSWLGVKGHSESVERRMSKDPAPVRDVCFSSLKSVSWFTISLSSGLPAVFVHSLPDKWALKGRVSQREGKYWPYSCIFIFLNCSGFLRKSLFFCYGEILWSVLQL